MLISKFYINGETNESDMTSFEKQYNINIDGYPSIYLVKMISY